MNRREFLGGVAALVASGCRSVAGRRSPRYERVLEAARAQIADGVVLCAAVGGSDGDEFVYAGRQGPQADAAPIDELTRFDMASITKTITASVCATLVTDGLLDPDAPFTEYLPEHVLGKTCEISLRHLATHSSGFGNFAGWHYVENVAAEHGAIGYADELFAKRPVRPLGTYCYSCYNYALLGTVAERVGGAPLDRLARERVLDPLGMSHTGWWPIPDDGHAVTVPLPMHDGKLRRTGEVHDEVARYAGRPIGNAGMFATLPDIMRFVTDLLDRRHFPKAHYDLLFTGTFRSGGKCRSFGFDLSDDGRPVGFSAASIRHTGFTGQLICVDPVLGFAGAVLTLRCPGEKKGTLGGRNRLLELCAGCPRT